MAGAHRDLLAQVERSEDEIVSLCQKLISIPSENPPGDVTAAAAFVSDTLRGWGLEPVWHEPRPGQVNLVLSIGGSGRTLILNGHLDVVPAGDPSRWKHPPFEGRIVDGWLWGRGVADMKGGVAALIGAVRVLAGADLPGRVVLSLVADEETGGRWGSRWLLQQAGLTGDACLIAEPSGPGVATIGQKGALWLRLRATGEPTHGSLSPYVGTNAILRLVDGLPCVTRVAGRSGQFPRELLEVLDRSKSWMATLVGEAATAALDHVTVNVGTLRGGTKVNMVPEEALAEIDIRVPLGCSTASIKQEIEAALEGTGVLLEAQDYSEPNFTPPGAPINRALEEGVASVMGAPPALLLQWATSDARHFRAAGIPAVQYGPAGPGIHGFNEAVPVEQLVRCSQAYVATTLAFLGQEAARPAP